MAGDKYNSDIIIRITGDNPCISYEIADILINSHVKSAKDYTAPLPGTYLIGTECEVFNLYSLKLLKSRLSQKGKNMTEYLTFFFVTNLKTFKVNIVKLPGIFYKDIEGVSFTLDTTPDYLLLKKIYEYNDIKDQPISFSNIRNYFENNKKSNITNDLVIGLGADFSKTLVKLNKYCNIDGEYFQPCQNIDERIIELYKLTI